MTERRTPAPHPGNDDDATHRPPPLPAEPTPEQPPPPLPDSSTSCAERGRRQGPPAAPRSGSARALTPTPYLGALTSQVGAKKTGRSPLLTDPAPSGMTLGFTGGR